MLGEQAIDLAGNGSDRQRVDILRIENVHEKLLFAELPGSAAMLIGLVGEVDTLIDIGKGIVNIGIVFL